MLSMHKIEYRVPYGILGKAVQSLRPLRPTLTFGMTNLKYHAPALVAVIEKGLPVIEYKEFTLIFGRHR